MTKPNIKSISLLIVICAAASGYRRAGFELVPGKNELKDVSEEQLEILDADPRISIIGTGQAADASKEASGALGVDISQLVELIRRLDTENSELWTADNKPKAVNFPADTSKDDREAAWQLHLNDLEK
ncbi:MAG: hypothetical protein HRU23_19035 [Gammaproteobacteria bacterium]|nr:hypothetical protein [Gammaproteobacteria bacterium]